MKFGTMVRVKDINCVQAQFQTLINEGLEACQLVYKPEVYTKEDAQIIVEAIKNTGIDVCSMFAGFRDTFIFWDGYHDYNISGINNPEFGKSRIEYIRAAVEFASWIGIKQVVIHAGYVDNNPFSPDFTRMVSLIKHTANYAKRFGVDLLLETGQETNIALKRLIELSGADNLFINFDTANPIIYGYGNPVDAIFTYGEYIRNMHAKDALPPKNIYGRGVETPIGEGYVDFKRVLKDLKAVGYDSYMIIEREIEGDQQRIDVLNAIKQLKEIWDNLTD